MERGCSLFVFVAFLFLFCFKVHLFILREKDSMHEQGNGRERRRETIPSRLLADSVEPNLGLDPTNREIMT